jgi:hypothetical protein
VYERLDGMHCVLSKIFFILRAYGYSETSVNFTSLQGVASQKQFTSHSPRQNFESCVCRPRTIDELSCFLINDVEPASERYGSAALAS